MPARACASYDDGFVIDAGSQVNSECGVGVVAKKGFFASSFFDVFELSINKRWNDAREIPRVTSRIIYVARYFY